MKVRHGWSGEVAANRWAKFDITLEEEDLRRMLGAGYDTFKLLGTEAAYQLLELEAERLVMAKLATRYGYDPAEAKTVMDRLEQQKRGLILQVRSGGR